MRSSLWIAALFAGLSAAWAGEPGQRNGSPDKDRVEQLIKKLSSDKFADRERASGELEKLGGAALEPLKKAVAAKDTDQETRSRAEKILAKLDQKLESAALLAPTKVHLVLKDTPVTEAVKELAKKSGYSIVIQGDVRKAAERKITLDTGETTFWQAFDQLCQKGGLVQAANPYGNIRFGNPPRIVPGGPIQIQPLPAIKERPVPLPVKDLEANAQAQAEILTALRVKFLAAEKKAAALAGQVQPAQAVQPPRAVGGVRPTQPGNPYQFGQINVTDGKPEDYPTHYAGAVRFRVLPYDRNTMAWIPDKAAGETLLILEVCAEPKLENFRLSGGARVDKAADDQSQALSAATEPLPAPPGVGGPVAGRVVGGRVIMQPPQFGNPYMTGTIRELVPIRLKLGEKQAKSLKELAGSVTAECLTPPQELVVIDDVLKAAGKSVKGKGGAAVDLIEITKQANGDVLLRVRTETARGGAALGAAMPGGPVPIQIVGRGRRVVDDSSLPTLEDAKGKPYQRVQVRPGMMGRGLNNATGPEITLVYRPTAGQGEPARLVLYGRRDAHLQAAFTFKDVKLP